MIPGTYCKGLKISGVNVKFLPGTYIIKDKPLEFTKGSQAVGRDVTFVLKGKSKLLIKDDAQVFLKAPKSGPYAGLVFFKVPETKKFGQKTKLPDGVSIIKSGGGLKIIGTAYFPSQELIISSASPTATQSPATSFIAYRMMFKDKANMVVHIDYEAGGVPPLLPRSDDGAKLVR